VLEESNDKDSEEDDSKDKGKAVITLPTIGSSRRATRAAAAAATLAVATTNAKAEAKATLEEINKEA